MPSDADSKKLADALAQYSNDPYGFVMFAFAWGKGDLEGKAPEPWQIELLEDIRDGLKTVDEVIQLATASGHGVGKSALVAWLILWAISTCPDTRGVVTANTQTQLQTKTWPELGKWYTRFIAKSMFRFTATAIHIEHPDTERQKAWRIDAIPWSEHNTEAFAGLHNEGKRILVVFDEASAVADKIWEVTEGALTDSNTQIIWAVFGNPTRNSGRFRECFHAHRRFWRGRRVDSREVSFTNKVKIQGWVDFYGEDSDFVRVRVRGVEPNQSAMQFIAADIVEAARGRQLRPEQYQFAPVIITLDPSWTGEDEWVVGKRQGLSFSVVRFGQKNDDDSKMAGMLAQIVEDEKADAVFIDAGYGTGIFSAGKALGYLDWTLVWFGGASSDPGCLNKRTEMWAATKKWLQEGGAIPNDEILCSDLKAPEAYVVQSGKQTGKLKLESKDEMKDRGCESPNRADALGLSFAFPVKKKEFQHKQQFVKKEYDVLDMHIPQAVKKYDPLRY